MVWMRSSSQGERLDFSTFYTAGAIAAGGDSRGLYFSGPEGSFTATSARFRDISLSVTGNSEPLPFLYSPPFALGMSVLQLLPFATASVVWFILHQGSFLLSLILVVGIFRLWQNVPGIALMSFVFLTFQPPQLSASLGQVNAIVLLFTCLIISGLRDKDRAWPGFVMALLAIIKPVFLLFPLYFVFRRRWRSVLAFCALLAGLTAASAAVMGIESYFDYFHALERLAGGTPFYRNQSVLAFVQRLALGGDHFGAVELVSNDPFLFLGLSAVPLAFGLAVILKTSRLTEWRSELDSLLLILMTFWLSPVTWDHNLTLLLPVLVGIFAIARNTNALTVISGFLLFSFLARTFHPETGRAYFAVFPQALIASWHFLGTLAAGCALWILVESFRKKRVDVPR
jgi:hypothetical protein